MSFDRMSIAALRAGYRDGAFTPEQVIARVIERVAAYPDPAVWIHRVPEETLRERARELAGDPDARIRLPLFGIPFAIKDNIDAAGLPTTAGCPEFSFVPAEAATVVRRLEAAGAILIGKTNMDQFATGLVGTRSPHGAPRCVYDRRYISGGSSSGSAVAVAGGLVAFSLGTDTAGSGRVPAAFNHLIGLKPTKGLLSMTGVVPACRSLDCVSIFANTIADARAVADVAEGLDPTDCYSRQGVPIRLPVGPFRFGVLRAADREFFGDDAAASLHAAAIERLTRAGGTPVEMDFAPFRDAAALLYEGPWVAERLAAIETFFADHADAMDPTVRQIIGGALGRTATDTFKAMYRLQALAREAAAEWRHFDIMLLPTTPTTYTVDEIAADPIGRNSRLGLYTNFVNLLDYAAIALPAGFRPNGLPFGVTLIGPAFSDRDLAALAGRMEAEAPDRIRVAVAGAHLSGLPLNHELTGLGAALVETTRTAKSYRLMALKNTAPPKPGLVHTPGFEGPGIEIEIWSLSPENFGRFVAGIPAPMGIGKVTLADGGVVPGFFCEAFALDGATDVTEFGGWRGYLESCRR